MYAIRQVVSSLVKKILSFVRNTANFINSVLSKGEIMLTVSRSTSFKVYGALGLMFFAISVYADEHAHKPSERNAERTMTPGKKWGTDEALRRGMDNIRQAMTASLEDIEKERLGAQDYQRLAEVVDKNVADMVKNCKLTKEADAAFHNIVLTDLTQSMALIRTSPKIQTQRAGALGVLQSLRHYGEYFQHPGWHLGTVKLR